MVSPNLPLITLAGRLLGKSIKRKGLVIFLLFVVVLFPTFSIAATIKTIKLGAADSGLTSPTGDYRFLDIADQSYSKDYQKSYNYTNAEVEVTYRREGTTLRGKLTARNLKPNFAYQIKLVGIPEIRSNEPIGFSGRWWQEEWDGRNWSSGQNLNNKGNGSQPNPNDTVYLQRRDVRDPSSPTGKKYRYTGYIPMHFFITDDNGKASVKFETGTCYHVFWKTSQRDRSPNDGLLKRVLFDVNPANNPAYEENYPPATVQIFGEWERLPLGQTYLAPGEYLCRVMLTEESFHGSGGTLAGNWAAAMAGRIKFTITQ